MEGWLALRTVRARWEARSKHGACMQLVFNTSVMIQGRAGKKVGFGVRSVVSLYLSFPTYSAVPPRLGRCPPRLRVKGQVLSAVSCLAVLRTQPRASAHARQVLTLEPRHGPATLKYKVMWAKAQPKGHKGELEPKGH